MSKNGKSHYGYKLHTIMDTDYDLIRRIDTTTANVHDSQVDLSEEGEVVYRDEDTSVWKQYSDIHQDKEKSSSLHEENQILKVWINNGLMKYSEQYHTSPNTSSKEQYFSVFRIVFKSASSFSTSNPASSGMLSSNGIRLFIRETDSGSRLILYKS